MCACKQKTSFFIEDILKDSKKPYKNLSDGPKEKFVCCEPAIVEPRINVVEAQRELEVEKMKVKYDVEKLKNLEREREIKGTEERTVIERDLEMEKMRVHLEQRRNTYPLYPTPVRVPWYKLKNYDNSQMSYYSEPALNQEQMLRGQLSRFPPPYTIRHYRLDRALGSCCWWGVGGRRKGGQVRFSAAQTAALERRFAAAKYLSPDERRALAASLRLSDRQVKTWFQNRRAKWRRCVPEADSHSPSSEDLTDDDRVADE